MCSCENIILIKKLKNCNVTSTPFFLVVSNYFWLMSSTKKYWTRSELKIIFIVFLVIKLHKYILNFYYNVFMFDVCILSTYRHILFSFRILIITLRADYFPSAKQKIVMYFFSMVCFRQLIRFIFGQCEWFWRTWSVDHIYMYESQQVPRRIFNTNLIFFCIFNHLVSAKI